MYAASRRACVPWSVCRAVIVSCGAVATNNATAVPRSQRAALCGGLRHGSLALPRHKQVLWVALDQEVRVRRAWHSDHTHRHEGEWMPGIASLCYTKNGIALKAAVNGPN